MRPWFAFVSIFVVPPGMPPRRLVGPWCLQSADAPPSPRGTPCLNHLDCRPPTCALRGGTSYGCLRCRPSGSFRAAKSELPMSRWGRVLPGAGVGFPVAQVRGQLWGGDIAQPVDAGRPVAVFGYGDLTAPKRPFNVELTGAARLLRASSSDRKERGRARG